LLQGQGFQITLLPPNSRGVVEPEAVRRALRPQTFLITIMHANNETGMLQPIQEIATLAREAGVLLHTDCAQSVGKHPVDVQALGADMLTVAGHKLYGPKGIGALYVRQGVELRPVLFGASQERGLRPGTENLPGALGLAAAARLAVQELPSERQRLGELSELLWRELKERLPQARLNAWGSAEEKLPNTLNVCIPGVDATELVEALARRVAISAGAACHAGRKSPSHVLTAMGISPQDALCSVRLSLGRHTRAEELKEAAAALAAAARQLAQAPPGRGGAP
jgi:cysteine desulfurase